MFTRSLVRSLVDATRPCSGGHGCPDVLEMESGDYAVIGADITATASPRLPVGSGCGPGERVVQVPRAVMLRARTGLGTGE
ncbi:MAG: hypothetical protein IT580_11820 [Verrucomicrobiales bacterium]|nr:hypothetical protein [Verrucomicrobiales bacterium]